jgi:hypothetical protein
MIGAAFLMVSKATPARLNATWSGARGLVTPESRHRSPVRGLATSRYGSKRASQLWGDRRYNKKL